MTAIHFLIHHWHRHAAYACLCVQSLRAKGGIVAEQLHATVTFNLSGSAEIEALKALGVTIHYVSTGWHSKVLAVESLFERRPEIHAIIQLDTDCTLTEDVDFSATIDAMAHGADLAVYPGWKDGLKQFQNRSHLWLPAFRLDHPEAKPRLNALTKGLLGVDFEEFVAGIGQWIYGGLTFYRRSARETKEWEAMQALAWLTHCDETIIMLVMASDRETAMRIKLLDHGRFPHRVNPPVFDLWHGPGMFHYAGDWYREAIPKHRAMITNALWRWHGLTLPSDAPVRPLGGSPCLPSPK